MGWQPFNDAKLQSDGYRRVYRAEEMRRPRNDSTGTIEKLEKRSASQKDAESKLAELRSQFDEHKTTQDGHMARIKAALPVKAKEEAEKALGYVCRHFRARDA